MSENATFQNSRWLDILLIVLLIGGLYTAFQLNTLEVERRNASADLIELSKAKYGIFNIDEWKAMVATVVTKKIEGLDLSESNKAEMRRRISLLLTTIINDLEKNFKQENQKTFLGIFKNAGARFMDVFGTMRRNVPNFTNQIIGFLENPTNRRDLKNYVLNKVDSYADDTFAETDYSHHDALLGKWNMPDKASAIALLEQQTQVGKQVKKPYTYALYALFFVLAALLLWRKQFSRFGWICIIAFSLIPLYLGITLPMIEIDARIASLRFQLLGEQVGFTNQVLFFKSKSILEVVELMFSQGKADLMAVGVLVMAFSVLFPLAKILGSLVYLLTDRFRQNILIKTLVFKTGKWSMADVMVVAIFMSYIGFSGIVSEQLSQLEGIAKNADVLTTNHSSLQTGFFMFAAFVLLSLTISNAIRSMDGAQVIERMPIHLS